ncbi:SusC/RagA family TonB-linked outer membrane protein [Confluentibacter sediminis]|uniref:SusC/RagA family TonB-linked outer membrane protein n=1 Tax=Confluentibacter sediminis TaxID=2219045 RepID=UPI0013A6F434|nr:SusC/RagA family TonB-linked outer membrane protein [Confluentibacter sediminis]
MKTFILLLSTAAFSLSPMHLISQNAKIVIEKDQAVKVDEVFDIIREQTKDYMFIYRTDLFKDLPKVQLKKGVIRMDALINKSLKGADLNVIVTKNKTIIIKELNTIRQLKIKGTISDQSGIPIPGVTVIIKGTNKGTTTDMDGNYTLFVSSPENVLVFSFLGYKKKEIVVGNQSTINIALEEDIAELDAVKLVTTGYQKIRPEQTTGSFATIGATEYESRINTTDFLTGLQNKLPGVLINTDVDFEGNSLFQIRGISTIEGNRSPLIVVDGYPTELSLSSIDPNDIESVTVLKDAAAATIYGVRASNGVVVIERKKGKVGKLKVDFRSTVSMNPKTNYNRFRWDDDVSAQQVDYMLERNQSNASLLYFYYTFPGLGQLFTNPKPVIILAQQAAGLITEDEAQAQYAELGAYNNTKDYSKHFLRTSMTRTHNMNVSGGSEKALYYLTANYNTTDSEIKTNSNDGFRLSARANFKLSDRLSLRLNTDFQESKSNSSPVPGINSLYPWERLQDEDGNPESVFLGSVVNPFYNQTLLDAGLYDNMYYPLIDMNAINDEQHQISNRINADLTYDLGKGFNISVGGIYEISNRDNSHLATDESSEVKQLLNRYAESSINGPVFNVPKGSFLKKQNTNTNSYTLRNQLNYNKILAENHSVNMILGGEIRSMINKSHTSSLFGYNDQTLTHQPVDYSRLSSGYVPKYANSNPSLAYNNLFNETYTQDRFVSLYSNLVYSFKNKYSVTGSFRIDQSNLFGTDPKYRYKPLWSVGAAWNIHKENFLQDTYWLKSLKLRGALGFNGNVAKNSLPRIIASDGYNVDYNDMRRLSLLSPANSKLRWEQTYNTNIGLDFSVFKNISGTIEYYVKKSTDVLATNAIDNSRGVTYAKVNESALRNNGLEFSIHADWITRKRFNWNSGIVFSYNTSKILDVYNKDVKPNGESWSYTNYNTNYLKGYSIGAVFNYRYAGLDPEDGRTLIYGIDGSKKHFDEDNDGINDVVYRGTTIPKYSAGFSNRVDIGNFYFYAMINYYGGFVTKIPVPDPTTPRPLQGAYNFWKAPGDELEPGMLPNLTELSSGYGSYIRALDTYTVDGTYFTIGDITASYSLRESQALKNIGIANLEFQFQASNVYTFALNDKNYSKAMGSYEKNYITPTYIFAVNISF